MSSDGLTDKQREFCRLVVAGHGKAAAYRQAFGSRNDRSAATAAARLMKNVKVQEEINKLRGVRDENAVLSRRERMLMLTRMASESHRAGHVADAVRCIQELNKMDGAYEPEKVEVSGALGVGAVVAALQERDLELG